MKKVKKKGRKINLRNYGDWIRLRNLLVYKAFNNTTKINNFINYEISDKKAMKYIPTHLIKIEEIDKDLITEEVRYVGKMAVENRFDLLGSGWVCYDSTNIEKLGNSIRWNTDIKTGYIWSSDNLDERKCINSHEGTDIKNVWELGRMNYLVPIALYILSVDNDKEKRTGIVHYCELLKDFIFNNPVGKGVNWVLPMEAAIRISNILISYDFISQMDNENVIDNEFKLLIYKSIYVHIKFIWNNQEKNIFGGRNGNHYYSNIVGLLFATGYLKERDSYCARIFKYAKNEFLRESTEQFYKEGGHFEQSTGYFKLTAEMLVFGAAIIIRNGYELSEEMVMRVKNNMILATRLQRSDGTYYSFGDCDSGCFIKTGYYGDFMLSEEAENNFYNYHGYCKVYGEKEQFFVEDQSSMESLVRYSEGILDLSRLDQKTQNDSSLSIEKQIVSMIAGEMVNISNYCRNMNDHIEGVYKRIKYKELMSQYSITNRDVIPVTYDEVKQIQGFLYKGMGFFVLRSKYFSLLFRIGNNESIGHSHNDSLHYEYEIAGKHFEEDSGTYTYTGYPKVRNKYRSTAAHNVPQYGSEQREFDGIFAYSESDYREVLDVTDLSITIRYWNDRFDHVRRIVVEDEGVIIEDFGKTNFIVGKKIELKKSPGYGVLKKRCFECVE